MVVAIENLINITEAARLMGVSRQTVYAMIKRGKLRRVKVSDRQYIDKGDLVGYRIRRK